MYKEEHTFLSDSDVIIQFSGRNADVSRFDLMCLVFDIQKQYTTLMKVWWLREHEIFLHAKYKVCYKIETFSRSDVA